jgi:hypothetical protein
MAKLKNIIKQLSEVDYKTIYESLMESNAEKSGYLLKFLREHQVSDAKIMEELDVNTNAYYTLRSRLNQKIEEYLLQQMESPRTDILKKVANINEIVFTKKKAISIATLKKLEKALLDYDLSNELTIVYKTLKKLHIHSEEHFNYKQLYNKHVAYMLAMDKAEDLLAEYFKKYGSYTLSGAEVEKMELALMKQEMDNVMNLYESHRLFVYQCCLTIFHRLFVEPESFDTEADEEPIEDLLDKVEKIFESYYLDSIYYHLKKVFEFLKLEYYNHYKVYRKSEKYFEDINDNSSLLISNYGLYTYPAQFLLSKLERSLRLKAEKELYEENKELFEDFEYDTNDLPTHITYVVYRALCCYYAGHYEEASQWINNLLNEVSLKKFPLALLEIKILLALQYCVMDDYDLFTQLVNSIQRQMRILGKEQCQHILILTKIFKTSINDNKKQKEDKIRALITKMGEIQGPPFSPTRFIRMDDDFVKMLA